MFANIYLTKSTPSGVVIHLVNYSLYTPGNPVICMRADWLWQITSDLWGNQYYSLAMFATVWALNGLTNGPGYWRLRWAQVVTDSVAVHQFPNLCCQYCTYCYDISHFISNNNISWCQSISEYSSCRLPQHNFGDMKLLLSCHIICIL